MLLVAHDGLGEPQRHAPEQYERKDHGDRRRHGQAKKVGRRWTPERCTGKRCLLESFDHKLEP